MLLTCVVIPPIIRVPVIKLFPLIPRVVALRFEANPKLVERLLVEILQAVRVPVLSPSVLMLVA